MPTTNLQRQLLFPCLTRPLTSTANSQKSSPPLLRGVLQAYNYFSNQSFKTDYPIFTVVFLSRRHGFPKQCHLAEYHDTCEACEHQSNSRGLDGATGASSPCPTTGRAPAPAGTRRQLHSFQPRAVSQETQLEIQPNLILHLKDGQFGEGGKKKPLNHKTHCWQVGGFL